MSPFLVWIHPCEESRFHWNGLSHESSDASRGWTWMEYLWQAAAHAWNRVTGEPTASVVWSKSRHWGEVTIRVTRCKLVCVK